MRSTACLGGLGVSESIGDAMKSGTASVELDRRWLRGEPGAFEEVYGRYRTRLEGVAYRILGNRPDAEDVVQNVFMALPGAAYRGSASLWTYLYRAAVNGSVNLIRSRRRSHRLRGEVMAQQVLVLGAQAARQPDSEVLEAEVLAAVAKALLRVRPQHRRVLVLRIRHGLSNTEIAEREGIPLATVGTWLRRGRQELREMLQPLLGEMRGG
jgi:RNA polymerase sigma-70 factor (ECF subfamily)